MARQPKFLNRSFAGGEMSPEMFGRVDDAVFQAGAALLRNFIPKPQGPAFARPGLELVGAAKDSTKIVRLMPFRYSDDQTMVLQFGRATVDAREIGYIRFHTNGSTLLYSLPAEFVSSKAVSTVLPGSEELDFGTAHNLATGDPVVLTFSPSVSITFTAGTPGQCNLGTASTILSHGTPVIFAPGGGGALPTEITARKIYYAHTPNATDFRISTVRFGSPMALAGAGSGTRNMASMPTISGQILTANATYYAIFSTANKIKLAASRSDALIGTAFNILQTGNGDLRVHKDYRQGDLVHDSGVGNGNFYCMKIPWGAPGDSFVYTEDHLDHATTVTNYWCREPGTTSAVTVSAGTDRITWAAHGLSNGAPVTLTGAPLPTGITVTTVVYVRNKAVNDFQVSLTPAGPIFDFVDTGTSVVALANAFYEVPHYYAETELFKIGRAQSNDVLTLCSKLRPIAELRRLGATRWVLTNFGAFTVVSPPSNVIGTQFRGEGLTVTTTTTANPSILTTNTAHQFAVGDSVYVTGLSGTPTIPDGFYIINASATPTLTLKQVEDGSTVAGVAAAGMTTPRIRFASSSSEVSNTYAVTAIGADGAETPIGNTVAVDNNLLVPGAYNTISWDAATGAVRYRIYKQLTGLFGFLGDTEQLTFKDNNIGPDLSIAPPVVDNSLYTSSEVTFDLASDLVIWGEAVNTPAEGSPVLFDTTGDAGGVPALPTGLTVGTTYYVLNKSGNGFNVATTPGGTAINLSGSPSGRATGTSGAFPSTVCYFEQRRFFAGSLLRSQDVFGTASGTESDMTYSLPTVDSDRVSFRISAREALAIKHLVPMAHLMLLGNSAEFRVTPINSDAITPASISVRPLSEVGVNDAQPVVVGSTAIFAAARGGHVRELGFTQDIFSYLTGDVSLRAAHLFDDFSIAQHAYQKAPMPVVWSVSSSGKLLGLTYVPEEKVGAWHQHDTGSGDVFESVACVAEGGEDRLYVVVKRGATRFIERMSVQAVGAIADVFRVDNGLSYEGAATTAISGLDHLEGKVVTALADGIVRGPFTVVGGAITLPIAAAKVRVGLPIISDLQTLPVVMQVDGFGTGREKNVDAVYLRVFESGAFQSGPSLTKLSPSFRPVAGTLTTDTVKVGLVGSWGHDGQAFVRQSDPLPLTIVGLTLEVAPGG